MLPAATSSPIAVFPCAADVVLARRLLPQYRSLEALVTPPTPVVIKFASAICQSDMTGDDGDDLPFDPVRAEVVSSLDHPPHDFLPRNVAIDIVHTISSFEDFGIIFADIQLLSCDCQISADSLPAGWHIDLESDEWR